MSKYKISFKALDASATREQIEAILLSYGYTLIEQDSRKDFGKYKNSSRKFIEIEYNLKVINTLEDAQDLPISRKVQKVTNEIKAFGFMTPVEYAEKNVPLIIHNGLIGLGLDKIYMLFYPDHRLKSISYRTREPLPFHVAHLKIKEKLFTMLVGNAGKEYKLTPVAAQVYRLFDTQGWELDDDNPEHDVSDWWNVL